MIKICIIGLGYVGLPICLKSSTKFQTVGFDTNRTRIRNLKNNFDQNNEFQKKILRTQQLLDAEFYQYYSAEIEFLTIKFDRNTKYAHFLLPETSAK